MEESPEEVGETHPRSLESTTMQVALRGSLPGCISFLSNTSAVSAEHRSFCPLQFNITIVESKPKLFPYPEFRVLHVCAYLAIWVPKCTTYMELFCRFQNLILWLAFCSFCCDAEFCHCPPPPISSDCIWMVSLFHSLPLFQLPEVWTFFPLFPHHPWNPDGPSSPSGPSCAPVDPSPATLQPWLSSIRVLLSGWINENTDIVISLPSS